jgi:hypothetical protein
MIGAAIMVAKIATGEVEDNPTSADKAHHNEGGKTGGAARATALTAAERSEIAKKAPARRWSKQADRCLPDDACRIVEGVRMLARQAWSRA